MIIGNSQMKKRNQNLKKKKNENDKNLLKQPCYTGQESKRGTSNLLDETTYSIVVLKNRCIFSIAEGRVTI